MSAQQDNCTEQEMVVESVFELEEWRLDSESQGSLIDVVPVTDIDVVPVMDRLQASLDFCIVSRSSLHRHSQTCARSRRPPHHHQLSLHLGNDISGSVTHKMKH
ncbi:hypothetical protein V5799_022292 [Amblyomma americanum]|uniref:Uncharacterized protein n=1 Tax=Amblyomma americanum TaxID=6943 RepID=A0AAQ4FMG9_AMBAM